MVKKIQNIPCFGVVDFRSFNEMPKLQCGCWQLLYAGHLDIPMILLPAKLENSNIPSQSLQPNSGQGKKGKRLTNPNKPSQFSFPKFSWRSKRSQTITNDTLLWHKSKQCRPRDGSLNRTLPPPIPTFPMLSSLS